MARALIFPHDFSDRPVRLRQHGSVEFLHRPGQDLELCGSRDRPHLYGRRHSRPGESGGGRSAAGPLAVSANYPGGFPRGGGRARSTRADRGNSSRFKPGRLNLCAITPASPGCDSTTATPATSKFSTPSGAFSTLNFLRPKPGSFVSRRLVNLYKAMGGGWVVNADRVAGEGNEAPELNPRGN